MTALPAFAATGDSGFNLMGLRVMLAGNHYRRVICEMLMPLAGLVTCAHQTVATYPRRYRTPVSDERRCVYADYEQP